MDVKTAPSRTQSMWRAWWQCHKQWRQLRLQLKQAGVAGHDPMYPLILEMGMIPARIGRLLVTFGIIIIMLFAAVEAVRSAVEKLWEPVAVIRLASGGRLVILDAAHGARWQRCPKTGQVCVELLSETGGGR